MYEEQEEEEYQTRCPKCDGAIYYMSCEDEECSIDCPGCDWTGIVVNEIIQR